MKGKWISMSHSITEEIIKEVAIKIRSIISAAQYLGKSTKTITRYLKRYQTGIGFEHGNKNKKPVNTINKSIIDTLEIAYTTFYQQDHTIKEFLLEISPYINEVALPHYVTIVNYFRERNVCSNLATKKTKKAIKERIKQIDNKHITPEENVVYVKEISNTKIEYKPHPVQPKIKEFGHTVEIDASVEYWVNHEKWTLHGIYDKATGAISLWFDKEETTEGYYAVLKNFFETFGVFNKAITDYRKTFIGKLYGLDIKTKNESILAETKCQVGLIFNALGIEHKATMIPQAKGAVERLWRTIQNSLPGYLRLHNIKTMDEANKILPKYLEERYNKIAKVHIDYNNSVIRKYDEDSDIVFSYRDFRTIQKGNIIEFNNKKYYLCLGTKPMFYKPGIRCMILVTASGRMLASLGNDYYNLIDKDSELVDKRFEDIQLKDQILFKIPKQKSSWHQTNSNMFVKRNYKKW